MNDSFTPEIRFDRRFIRDAYIEFRYTFDKYQEGAALIRLSPAFDDIDRLPYAPPYINALVRVNLKNLVHSLNEPAIITEDGSMYWYDNGLLHRKSGPAIVKPDGTLMWYKRGFLHRDNGPAVISPNGEMRWYKWNRIHRLRNPALIEPDGTLKWYDQNGLFATLYTEEDRGWWLLGDTGSDPKAFKKFLRMIQSG